MRGTLTDSGPLYALIDRDDDYHAAAGREVDNIELPMLTTWPCLTETMHFLRKSLGWAGQNTLLELIKRGDVVILDSDRHNLSAVSTLMEEYLDTTMDLADASLVSAAANLGKLDVFSFDSHFHAFRIQKRRQFRVIP